MAEGKKGKKAGKQKGREINKRYIANKTMERNKVKRVLQSEGVRAAEKYATKHLVVTHLHSLPLYVIKAAGKDHKKKE